ncbi:hypothetical protein MY04_4285 [Flammeovirga sp. MY04]|uniref:biotin/lipoyl-containing protein n=1 Tax=Flammeovirga sp. MY04 TaxID=1191459 RepID=UPI0008061186|nr:biotin/lipoyl-containing protein [Flammeovirga sp. MY04]ANQ51627.1 hypothetical protein MY04_4285 [Flammeovirga sp. MY04]
MIGKLLKSIFGTGDDTKIEERPKRTNYHRNEPPSTIIMPRISDDITSGKIVEWKIKVGDKIDVGSIVAEVDTNKATFEIESYEFGTVLHITNKKEIDIDEIICIIGNPGDDISPLLND